MEGSGLEMLTADDTLPPCWCTHTSSPDGPDVDAQAATLWDLHTAMNGRAPNTVRPYIPHGEDEPCSSGSAPELWGQTRFLQIRAGFSGKSAFPAQHVITEASMWITDVGRAGRLHLIVRLRLICCTPDDDSHCADKPAEKVVLLCRRDQAMICCRDDLLESYSQGCSQSCGHTAVHGCHVGFFFSLLIPQGFHSAKRVGRFGRPGCVQHS